jgi:hypothetical protein
MFKCSLELSVDCLFKGFLHPGLFWILWSAKIKWLRFCRTVIYVLEKDLHRIDWSLSQCPRQNRTGPEALSPSKIAIYGPMIAPYVMLLMWANPLLAQVWGGWALEIETFLGIVKWHRAVRQVPYGAQTSCRRANWVDFSFNSVIFLEIWRKTNV